MAMLARLEAHEEYASRRSSNRRTLSLQVPGSTARGEGVDVFIHDLSLTGLLIETWASLTIGTQIEVDLPEAGRTAANVVWNTGHYFGCQFASAIPAPALSAAMLKNPFGAQHAVPYAMPEGMSLPADESEPGDGYALGMRLRIIIAMATAAWAAILLVGALA